MKTIMFSLLIHEEPEVVLDQLINLFKYNRDAYVVIHINPNFRYSESISSYHDLLSKLRVFDHVIINPQRLNVGFNNIIQAHISNIKAVLEYEYDYFCFIASNELFVRSGLNDFVSKYEFGCENRLNEDWAFIDCLKKDRYLKNIKEHYGFRGYSYSQIEGSFYSKQIISRIASIIDKEYDYDNQTVVYPREEVYFSTLANGLYPNKYRYNGCCCKIRWEAGILFTSLGAIRSIISGDLDNHFYSVKRVERKIDNYLRSYIRKHVGGYSDDVQRVCGINIKEKGMIPIFFCNAYFLVIFFVRRRIALLYHRITHTHAG